ncbi:MAG TPA: amidohydrolase family protein [Bryobacteraceae bacterium]|nr:amidohydrolase family protein [Bryobacteraceae bacterium]
MRHPLLLCLAGFATVLVTILAPAPISGDDGIETPWRADQRAFTSIEPIDTHAHAFKVDARFYDFLHKLHLHLVDIVVANKDDAEFNGLEPKIEAAKAFVNHSNGQAVLCTTFDPFKFSDPKFADRSVQQLNRDFAWGAVAVKIWKNVGMELRDQSGHFVMPDDARLEPIYKDIAAHGKTLIAHLAEPDSCWQPPNRNSPDYKYYSEHPEWYMYKQPDHPAKATIIQARDRILKGNPNLRVIGAHLGSLETNLDEIGRRLDRYPNFAVDVAARVAYLTIQPREKTRDFLIRYQDRILYGTDLSFSGRQNAETAEKTWEKRYEADWAYFSSRGTVEYQGRKVQALGLPAQVLSKLYHDNAVRWIPGVLPAK